mmetsp:Transcript_55575/g.180283  ORF Transcript_55575/g.180283 Transcript_55575/m.180283 type:complete len:498 (-) Transcript_55575:82-1575(-)
MSDDAGSLKRPASNGATALKRPKSDEDFATCRERLVSQRYAKAAAAASLTALSADEEALDCEVLQPAISSAAINPNKNFLDFKKDYDDSALFALLHRMPKGAVLHTHGIATGDFNALVEIIRADGHFYVWQGDEAETVTGSMRSYGSGADVPKDWHPARNFTQEQLYQWLTLPLGLPNVEACWKEFGKLWDRIRLVACVAPIYYGRNAVFWDTLQRYHDANIMYLEIKEPLFAPWTDYDGTEVPDEQIMVRFRDTVESFRADHPGFLGARMVMTCLKCQTEDDVRQAFRRAVALKKQFPDHVAGFDMAGPEDLLKPIRDYATVLQEERAAALEQGIDFPLMIHAGETNIPEASQIFDAVAIGCERIGHGFALARHPSLIEEVLALGISLECCPISNQVLGYFPNLANHDAIGLFRAGVPLTISPDDAGMWHYFDVSYDFAAVAKAWNLSLIEVKALVRNSLLCSTLRGPQKEEALAAWEKAWDAWVTAELKSVNGAK